jgi:predicted ATP-grasp superfamily ATP-dependent carboligase
VPELFHHGGLGFVRSLGRLGVPVYGVHDTPRAPAAYSRYAAGRFVWNGVSDDPVEFLRGIAESIGERAVLVPQDDVSTEVVDENAAVLSEWFLFPERSPELVRALSNKREMNRLCREHDVPTAETVSPASDEELERFLDDATFPIVLKGAESWVPGTRTSARLAIAASRDEVSSIWAEMSPAERGNTMLQEYIPGGPDTVWMFNGYFDEHSDCLVGFTGRKLRQSPPYTGMTSLGVCLPNTDVAQITTRFMKEIGYRGVLDIGYRYDARDGRYKLLDVNPRLGATFRLFVDPNNDMDVARALYLDLTGQVVPQAALRDGRKWIVEPWDLRSSLRYARDGSLTFRQWARSLRGIEEAAWFALDDPRPFAVMCLEVLRGRARYLRGGDDSAQR